MACCSTRQTTRFARAISWPAAMENVCNAMRPDMGWIASLRNLVSTFPRRWLCARAARNIAVSNHVAMQNRASRARERFITELKAPPCASQDPSPASGTPLRIGYAGRLVQEKGLPILLDAVKHLADAAIPFHLTFIGDGTQRVELEASVRRLGLQDCVTFTGELRGSDFKKALRSVQVLVMPSRWEETAGLAAIEQMMHGGVVVAADVGGLSEVVGDAGLKFFVDDSQHWLLAFGKFMKIRSPAFTGLCRPRARPSLLRR